MFKKIIICSSILFSLILTVSFSESALAQQQSIVDTSPQKYDEGNYTVNDMVNVFVTYSQRALGIIGSIALLMFVYGGIMFLISGGSSEKVTKAKGIIIAAVVGIIIVFSSYLIIKFVLGAIGRDDFQGEKMEIGKKTITNKVATT